MAVSKWEILEYLRIHGPTQMSELAKVFGTMVRYALDNLRRSKHIKKFVYITEETPFGVIKKKMYINKIDEVKHIPKKYRSKVYVELAPYSFRILKKWGVRSFYDVPFAKISEKYLIRKKINGKLQFRRFG